MVPFSYQSGVENERYYVNKLYLSANEAWKAYVNKENLAVFLPGSAIGAIIQSWELVKEEIGRRIDF